MPSSGSKRRKRSAQPDADPAPHESPTFAPERLRDYSPEELRDWHELFTERRNMFTGLIDSIADELHRRLCGEG